MRYIVETVSLAVIGFIILVFTIVYHMVVSNITHQFYVLYTNGGFNGTAAPILDSAVIYGYLACGVFFTGAILLYLVKAHEEEYETYEERLYRER